AFGRAVRGMPGGSPLAKTADGLAVMSAIHAVRRSAFQGGAECSLQILHQTNCGDIHDRYLAVRWRESSSSSSISGARPSPWLCPASRTRPLVLAPNSCRELGGSNLFYVVQRKGSRRTWHLLPIYVVGSRATCPTTRLLPGS